MLLVGMFVMMTTLYLGIRGTTAKLPIGQSRLNANQTIFSDNITKWNNNGSIVFNYVEIRFKKLYHFKLTGCCCVTQ